MRNRFAIFLRAQQALEFLHSLGHFLPFNDVRATSALPPISTAKRAFGDGRKVPKAGVVPSIQSPLGEGEFRPLLVDSEVGFPDKPSPFLGLRFQ
jgi:hypothetical protein